MTDSQKTIRRQYPSGTNKGEFQMLVPSRWRAPLQPIVALICPQAQQFTDKDARISAELIAEADADRLFYAERKRQSCGHVPVANAEQ